MKDVTITRNAELMVAGVNGETDAGVEFIDAFTPSVLDAGKIITGGLPDLTPESADALSAMLASAAALAEIENENEEESCS